MYCDKLSTTNKIVSRTARIRMSMTDCSLFWLQILTVAGVSGVPSHAAQFHAVVG